MAAAIPSGGAGQTILQQLGVGIPMPFWTLKALTIFPVTGVLGLNHAAMNNQAVALLKAGSLLVSAITIAFLLPYYPWFLRKYIVLFSRLGPWFMFDIFEVLNANFMTHGFRLPLNITLEGLTHSKHTDGRWKLTTAMAASIMATFAASGVAVASYLPANIVPASISQNIALISGGSGVLLGGVALAALFMSKSPATGGFTPLPMTGGGLPPLSHFADKLLSSKDESYAFFAVLALIVLGGVVITASKS